MPNPVMIKEAKKVEVILLMPNCSTKNATATSRREIEEVNAATVKRIKKIMEK